MTFPLYELFNIYNILLGSVTCTRGELIVKAVMLKHFKTLIVTIIYYSLSFLCPIYLAPWFMTPSPSPSPKYTGSLCPLIPLLLL